MSKVTAKNYLVTPFVNVIRRIKILILADCFWDFVWLYKLMIRKLGWQSNQHSFISGSAKIAIINEMIKVQRFKQDILWGMLRHLSTKN